MFVSVIKYAVIGIVILVFWPIYFICYLIKNTFVMIAAAFDMARFFQVISNCLTNWQRTRRFILNEPEEKDDEEKEEPVKKERRPIGFIRYAPPQKLHNLQNPSNP